MQAKSNYELPQAGEIYGSITLTGISYYKQEKGGRRLMVEGLCKCGDVRGYAFRFLKSGVTKSCGCGRREGLLKSRTTHNLSRHPLYQVYQDMIKRCYSPACKAFEDYGGRGITVCQEWLDDIFAFRSWAMLNGYETGLQLDRIDNNGNYEPDNCRFVTKDVNNINTRRNIYVTAFGETKTATEWSRDRRCKVAARTVLERINNGRWDAEKAITSPPNARKKEFSRVISSVRYITAWGETKGLMDWVEDERCNVGYSGLKIRLNKGWIPEDAISIKAQH